MFILIILRDASFLLTGNKVTKSATIYHVYGRRGQSPKELLLHASGPWAHPQPLESREQSEHRWANHQKARKWPSQVVTAEWRLCSPAPCGAHSTLFAYKTCDDESWGKRVSNGATTTGGAGCSWFLAPCSAEKYAKKLSTLVIFICVPASCFGATRRMRNAKKMPRLQRHTQKNKNCRSLPWFVATFESHPHSFQQEPYEFRT